MEAGSIETALERIEAAIARIDLAAAHAREAAADGRDRHDRLRGAVADALRQVDALITQAPEPGA